MYRRCYIPSSFQLRTGAPQRDFELDTFLTGEGGGTLDLDGEKFEDLSCDEVFSYRSWYKLANLLPVFL
jgi:hypothetical protein